MASTHDELFAAIEGGDVERVRGLLEAEPTLAAARDHQGVSALLRARYRFDLALADVVLAHIGELDVFEAATFDDVDRLASLLDGDPSLVSASSGDGFTALHLAAFFGKLGAARMLIDRGAEPEARGRGWMTGTPLNSAAAAGHVDIAVMLLEAGADPDARQAGGWTPLHSAAHNGDVAMAQALIDRGADPEAVDDEGRGVLELAEDGAGAAVADRIRAAIGG